MTDTHHQRHPWAVNIYHGRKHVDTSDFKRESSARFFFEKIALAPGQTAHLMHYEGNYTWNEVAQR